MNDSTWTWISGSNTIKQLGVYGEKGVPSVDNQPGARHYATGCYDTITQELWLFGGSGNITTLGVFNNYAQQYLMTNFCKNTSRHE